MLDKPQTAAGWRGWSEKSLIQFGSRLIDLAIVFTHTSMFLDDVLKKSQLRIFFFFGLTEDPDTLLLSHSCNSEFIWASLTISSSSTEDTQHLFIGIIVK